MSLYIDIILRQEIIHMVLKSIKNPAEESLRPDFFNSDPLPIYFRWFDLFETLSDLNHRVHPLPFTTIAYCLLPIAYCLLPTAYCLLPIAYCLTYGKTALTNHAALLSINIKSRASMLPSPLTSSGI